MGSNQRRLESQRLQSRHLHRRAIRGLSRDVRMEHSTGSSEQIPSASLNSVPVLGLECSCLSLPPRLLGNGRTPRKQIRPEDLKMGGISSHRIVIRTVLSLCFPCGMLNFLECFSWGLPADFQRSKDTDLHWQDATQRSVA